MKMKRQASVARKVQFAGQVSNSLERHDWTGKLDHTDVKSLRDGANSRSRSISMTSIGKPTGAATSKRGAGLGANGALALVRSTSATICDRGCDLTTWNSMPASSYSIGHHYSIWMLSTVSD